MEIEAETASAHTRSRRSARSGVVEVITRGERRRAWSADQKRLIVTEAMQPGAMPAEVARRWGIGTGLLYTWRRQLLAGEFGEPPLPVPAFAQVTLAPVYPYGQGRGCRGQVVGGVCRNRLRMSSSGRRSCWGHDQPADLRRVAGLREHALARSSTAFACASKSMMAGSKGVPTHWTISAWLSCFGSPTASRNSA